MRTKAAPPPEVKLLPEYFRAAGYYTTCSHFTDFQVKTPPTIFDEWGDKAHWRGRPEPGTPFFAQFHGLITHESRIYLGDAEFARETADVTDDMRHDPDEIPLPPYYPDTEVFRFHWARLYDLITQMDHWVGEILRQLEDDGLVDNTIVVFWSEHGPGVPRAKRWANEAGVREPLIIRWPGRIEPGTSRADVVQMMDLAPTMLEMCGLPVPEHMEAKPIYRADGTAVAPNQYAFGARGRMDEQQDISFTVRDARFRYTRHLHPDRPGMQHLEYADHLATWAEMRRLTQEEAMQVGSGQAPDRLTPLQRSVVGPNKPPEELFDIDRDPHETANLIDDASLQDVKARLSKALDGWLDTYAETALIPEQDLIDRWRPGGASQKTATPTIEIGDLITASCETPGASIGWTTDAPRKPEPPTFLDLAIGSPDRDGRYWHLYSAPFEQPDLTVWVRAWRLGFDPSDEVVVPVGGRL
jgi:uncharacterized sulfatase